MASKFGGVPVEKTSQYGGIPVEDEEAPSTLEEQVDEAIDTTGDYVLGGAEVALTMGTGMVAAVASGLGGVGASVASYIRGEGDSVDAAASVVNQMSQENTFEPRTDAGRDLLRIVGVPFQALDDWATEKGAQVLKVTGSPELATAIKTGLVSAPDLIGLKGVKLRRAKRARQKAVEQQAADIGLEPEAAPKVQREQIIEQARTETGGRTAKGMDMGELQAAVMEAKEISKANVNNLFAEARGTRAAVPASEVQRFRVIANESLEGFNLDAAPLSKRLRELGEVEQLPDGAKVKLDELQKFRQRLNRDKPPTTDTSQQTAIGILKGQLDEFMDAQFNADMVSGDPVALAKWKAANAASAAYKARFKDDNVIRQLGKQQAKPEEVRKWIFGAGKMGFKTEAGATISRIKKIVGEGSPQFTALRQDALLNILDPLLKEEPNFKQFARVYDDVVKSNPTLVNELFPDSKTHLNSLRSFATAVEKSKRPPLGIRIEETISRALFGHAIAKAAIRVSLGGQVLKILRRGGEKTQRTRILGEVLGYDPDVPLIPGAVPQIGAGVQTLIQESEDVNDT